MSSVQSPKTDFLGSCRRAAFILVFPVLNYLFLRLFFHYFWQVSIGWSLPLTDYELIFPAPAAFILYFSALERDYPCPLSFRKKALYFTLSANIALLCLTYFYNPSMEIIWWTITLTTLISAFFLFVPPSFYFRNRYRIAIIPSVFIAL